MSDLKVMRFADHGPADTGMPEWDPMPADGIAAGEPVQRGHVYHNDEANGLMTGVWDCTAFTAKPGPYDVNEFMLILEGSVTIVDENGDEETISAGQSFIIPKGLPCTWKQTEYVRKFFVIFDDASGMTPEDSSALKVIRPDPGTALAPMDVDASQPFVGDLPTQNIDLCFGDMTGQMTTGVWDSTPFERQPFAFPRHELMHLLEGSVTISDGQGGAETFVAGDTFFVPKGAVIGWKSTEYVRKIFVIFIEKQAEAQASAAE